MTPTARDILADPGTGNRLAIPTIVLAEAWDLAREKRVRVAFEEVLRAVRVSETLVWPLELTTVTRLPGRLPDIHDEIIVATALELAISYGPISIITRDPGIQALAIVSSVW